MSSVLGRSTLALGLLACAPATTPVEARARQLLGPWRVEFTFSGGSAHVLQFEARAGGKGTFQLLDPTSSLNAPAEPAKAGWQEARPDQVTFSGPVAFAIGNVGREPGTLVFKGAWQSADSIAGRVHFFREGQRIDDPATVPARSGDFTARRLGPAPRGRGALGPD